jgi:carboxyl-terminal processing protease
MTQRRAQPTVAAWLTAACALAALAWPHAMRAADLPAASGPASLGAAPFDARQAWAEWSELLTLDYAYFERPGVNGPKILAHFAPRALAATNQNDFIEVAKVVAHNFADPHFNVGPGTPNDPSLVPTASDLYGGFAGGRFWIRDVRAGSDASVQGVPAGATIVSIDDVAPAAAVERLLEQPISALSAAQVVHGLNLALAGVRDRSRQLVVQADGSTREFTLRAAAQYAAAVAAAPAVVSERRGRVGIIGFNNSLGRNETIAAFRQALQSLLDTRALIIDLRNTPSGGNTTVARAIMGHFVSRERPYQVHVVPGEQRRHGVPRKFVEYVLPLQPHYQGQVFVLGGRWTSSMGEGLMIGFDAIGARTAGSQMALLLGAMFNETLPKSGATVELGEEQLFQVNGAPREAFRPALYVEPAEAGPHGDPTLRAVMRALAASTPPR